MKNYSLLAILSLGIGIFSYVAAIIPKYAFCAGNVWLPEAGFLIGIVALIHIKKKNLRGTWMAILGIIIGAFGSFILVCL